MIKTRRVSSIRGRVDFVVITIRDDEFTAVRNRFTPSVPVVGGQQHYDSCTLRKADGGLATVAVARSTGQGHSAAALATKNAIQDLSPQWVVFAGIACAVPDSEFTLGDVLLADNVHDFSITAAIDGGSIQLRPGGGSMHRSVERLLMNLPARRDDIAEWASEKAIGRLKPLVTVPEELDADCFYGLKEERETLRDLLKRQFSGTTARRMPVFSIGAVATANVLVKDTAILRRWKSAARQITHIEMEFGGAYYVARREEPEMPLLSVRGISDIVGLKRSDEWTQFACDAAASFLHALIRVLPNEAFELRRRTLSASMQRAVSRLPQTWQRLVNVCVGSVIQLLYKSGRLLAGESKPAPSVEAIIEAFTKSSTPLVVRIVDPEERIPRAELGPLQDRFSSDMGKVLCVIGGPGGGKTALLALVSQNAANDGIATLALKADLLPKVAPFENWGSRELQMEISALDAVRVVASRGRVLVVVDQLDALSSIVAVSSDLFNLVVDFIRQCAAIANVCVVCSCREFDFIHDARFDELKADTLTLAPPPWEEVRKQLERHGITGSEHWPDEFRKILQTPQHLRVFLDRFIETGRSDFRGSYHLMLDDLWTRNVTSEDERTLLDSLTGYLMKHETLWAPVAAFAAELPTIYALKSKGLLEVQDLTVGFRHQTLLEHSKARYFTRTDQSFSQYVQDHETSLQVRPTVWSVLEYLRSARPQKYQVEIESLFTTLLRLHLRYLLIEFLGQHKAPQEYEKALMGARLADADDRIRALISIVGNLEWFHALRGTHLPAVMRGDIQLQWPMVGVINGAWRSDHDACFDLVKNNWYPDPEKDPLTHRVLRQTDKWGADELEMASTLIRRSKDTGDRLFWAEQMVYDVSEVQPEMAPRLFVDTMIKLAESSNEHNPLESNRSWYDLPGVAEAAPIPFLRAGWDWFVSTCEKHHHGAVSSVLYRYEGYSLSLDENSRRPESPVLSAYLASIEGTATADPSAFAEITRPSWASENAVVHRMLIRGLTSVVESKPEVGLEYLAGDRRRFQVGSYYSEKRSDSVKLITALTPVLNPVGMRRLESLIVEWTQYRDGQELSDEQREWDREDRLHLLDAIPVSLRSADIARLVDSEKAELPGWDRKLPRSRSGFVRETSPLTKDQMAEASEQEIVDVICNTPDIPHGERERQEVEGGWEEPGGPRAAGRQLAELTKESPLKVVGVITQLVSRGQEGAASSAFNGLADSSLTRDQILVFARALIQLQPKSENLRHDIAYMLCRRAKRPHGIPDDLCVAISGWLTDAASVARDRPEPAEPEDEKLKDDGTSVLWGNAGRVGLRSIDYPFWLLLAVTDGYVQRTPPAVSAWLSAVERCLTANISEQIWANYCTHLGNIRYAEGHEAARRADCDRSFPPFPATASAERRVNANRKR